jgi:FdhE protein
VRSRKSCDDVKPDPDVVGGVAEPQFVRLPDPVTMFAERARRLQALAVDNPLGPYMVFLRGLVAAQAAVADGMPRSEPPQALPAKQQLQDDPDFAAILNALLMHHRTSDAPADARAARDRVAALDPASRLALATGIFDAAYEPDRIGESLYIAAAMQVYLARRAACLDQAILQPHPENLCPCCGAAPVASLIAGWTRANKARYLCCSLCGTLWNFVRIKCVSCGSTDGISYYTIDGVRQDVAVETCTACRTYIKHLQQHENPRLEPFADDIASHGLDVLIREQGFGRSGVNPLLIGG